MRTGMGLRSKLAKRMRSVMANRRTCYLVLTFISLLNYIDRSVISGASDEFNDFIRRTLHTRKPDIYLGLLQSGFTLGTCVASLCIGHLVQFHRPFRILSAALMCWCTTITLAGLARATENYWCLLAARTFSGIGEAALFCLVPPFIADTAPANERGKWLALFYTATPVGTALGYVYSSNVTASFGGNWSWTYFFEVMVMGPLTALVMTARRETWWGAQGRPQRRTAGPVSSGSGAGTPTGGTRERLSSNGSYSSITSRVSEECERELQEEGWHSMKLEDDDAAEDRRRRGGGGGGGGDDDDGGSGGVATPSSSSSVNTSNGHYYSVSGAGNIQSSSGRGATGTSSVVRSAGSGGVSSAQFYDMGGEVVLHGDEGRGLITTTTTGIGGGKATIDGRAASVTTVRTAAALYGEGSGAHRGAGGRSGGVVMFESAYNSGAANSGGVDGSGRALSMCTEVRSVLSSVVFVLVMLGNAAFTAVTTAISLFGTSYIVGLGFMMTEKGAAASFGALVSIAGLLGGPMGGALMDWAGVSGAGRGEMAAAGGRGGGVTDSLLVSKKLRVVLFQLSLLMTLGTTVTLIGSMARSTPLFFACLFFGVFFLFAGTSHINVSLMGSVAAANRSFALATSQVGQHLLGDLPYPIIIGLVKDNLAPACAGGNSGPLVQGYAGRNEPHGRGGEEEGGEASLSGWMIGRVTEWLTSAGYSSEAPVEPAVDDDCIAERGRLRLSLVLMNLWLLWAVLAFTTAFIYQHAHVRRQSRHIALLGSLGEPLLMEVQQTVLHDEEEADHHGDGEDDDDDDDDGNNSDVGPFGSDKQPGNGYI